MPAHQWRGCWRGCAIRFLSISSSLPGASIAAAAAARMAAAAAAAAAEPHKIWTDPDFEIPVALAMGYEKDCHLLLVALLDRFAGL
jgi:hypothetical protein